MTNYTIREDAQAFLDRFTTAPDLASHANLTDELKERYLTLATQTQMLAESNDTWATKSRETASAVEAAILDLVSMFDDDCVPGGLSEIARILGIDLTEQRTYTVIISASVSMMVPKWLDRRPSTSDFAASGLCIEHDEFETEMYDYSIEEIEE